MAENDQVKTDYIVKLKKERPVSFGFCFLGFSNASHYRWACRSGAYGTSAILYRRRICWLQGRRLLEKEPERAATR